MGESYVRRCPLLDMTERFGVKIPAAQMEKYLPFSLVFSTWNGISQVLLIYSCFPFSLKHIILDVLYAKLLGGLWQEVLHGVQLWDCYRQPSLIDSAMDAWCCFWAWGSVGKAQQPQRCNGIYGGKLNTIARERLGVLCWSDFIDRLPS